MGVTRVVLRQSKDLEVLAERARLERACFRADNQLLVSAVAESAGEQEELVLPSAQFACRVEMNDFHWALAPAHIAAHFACFRRTYRAAIQAISKP